MPRQQLIIFLVLLTLSLTGFVLNEPAKLAVSTKISSVILYPVTSITRLFEYLTITRTKIERLEILINQLQMENIKLKKMTSFDTTDTPWASPVVIKAYVIGRDPANINGFLLIDKGRIDGVFENQPVIATNGLIGKVKSVDINESIVETIENNGFAVSSIDTKTGVHGIIKQRGDLNFDYIRIEDEIYTGDSIYTSGMSDIFPPGILVGMVRSIKKTDDLFFKRIFITPSVRVNRLNAVYLVFRDGTKK